MDRLRQLRLEPGWIYEAVVCTSVDGAPHAAPAGVATDDFRSVRLDLYDTSRSLGAIRARGCFVVDLPRDEHTLFRALYARDGLAFGHATAVDSPCLADAAATIELDLIDAEPMGGLTRVVGRVVEVTRRADVRLINRAAPLLVESLILATRLDLIGRDAVLAQVDEHLRVAQKVAPGSAAAEALERLRLRLARPS